MKDPALNPGTANAFPDVVGVDSSGPTATDGYAYLASIINDLSLGPMQAIMDAAGLIPNSVTEAAGVSQIVEAIQLINNSVPGQLTMHNLNDDPAVFGLKIVTLTGQLLLVANYPKLVANQYVGDGDNPTATSFYRTNFDDTIRSTTGTHIKLIDARGLSLRATGDAIVNGRTKNGPVNKWDVQEDLMFGHFHDFKIPDTTIQNFIQSYSNAGINSVNIAGSTGGISNGFLQIDAPRTDGVNGTPRIGSESQGNSFGMQPAMFVD